MTKHKTVFDRILHGYLYDCNEIIYANNALSDEIIMTIKNMYLPYKLLQKSLNKHCLWSFTQNQDKEFTNMFIQKTIERMYAIFISQNQYLIKKDQEMNAMYFIETGQFINDKNIIIKQTGDFIGEFDLLFNDESLQSIKAFSSENIVWKLTSDSFDTIREILRLWNIKRFNQTKQILYKISMFENLTDNQIFMLLTQSKFEIYNQNETIISKLNNKSNDNVYIILNGIISVHINNHINDILQFHTNQYFVWKLLNGSYAESLSTQCKLLCINYKQFRFIMTSKSLFDLKTIKTNDIINTNQQLKLSDFNINQIIGIGSFGKVYLVRKKIHSFDKVYALKEIKKSVVIEMCDEHHILNEKYALSCIHSVFCLQLISTFQNDKYVYFLTEAVLGGDLFHFLEQNANKIKIKYVQFYAACIVEAFEHLHSMNIIYRDLKLENILIDDNNGYLKLIDFGLIKKMDYNFSNTLCGTSEYLAPEVITGYIQSFTVDWWSLGILIYEMIFGNTPFESDENNIYESILCSKIIFPKNVNIDENIKDFINKLLEKNPNKRLGNGINGSKDVKKHEFFQDIDFNKLQQRMIASPFIPKLKSLMDTSNFDQFYDDNSDDQSSDDNSFDEQQLSWAQLF
eukprot:398133_1